MLEEIKNPTAARRDGAQYLHGPRLEIDSGHVSQADIDEMFSGNNSKTGIHFSGHANFVPA